jgi:hypothetical protein
VPEVGPGTLGNGSCLVDVGLHEFSQRIYLLAASNDGRVKRAPRADPSRAANPTVTIEWARIFMKTRPTIPPTVAPSKVLPVVPSGIRMSAGTTTNAKSKPARAPNAALGGPWHEGYGPYQVQLRSLPRLRPHQSGPKARPICLSSSQLCR